jgi:hypothetical protein
MPLARRRLLSAAALLLSLPALPASASALDVARPVAPAAVAAPALETAPPATATAAQSSGRTALDRPASIRQGAEPGTLILDRPAPKGRIVAGVVTDIKTVPWQVWLYSENAVGSSMCGGSIVGPMTVITAAHCVERLTMGAEFDNNGLGVIAGISNFMVDSPGDIAQARKAASWTVHPRYTPNRVDLAPQGDIAVVTLAAALDLSGTNAKAIPLPPVSTPASVDGEPVPVGPAAKISGYGLQTSGVDANGQLFSLDTAIVDPDECGGSANNAVGLCAKSPSGTICSGDSGGGLVSNGVLVGVVSVGDASCASGGWANYASLLSPENRQFIASPTVAPPVAPRVTKAPEASAPSTLVGAVTTCSGAGFDGGASVKYVISNDLGVRLATSVGPSIAYTHTAADVGRKLRCRAYGSNPGGTATSVLLEFRNPITAPPAPAPTPTPIPKPTPKPGSSFTGLGDMVMFGTVTKTVRRGSVLTVRAGLRKLAGNVAKVRVEIQIRRGSSASYRTIAVVGGSPASGATEFRRTFKHRMRGYLTRGRWQLRLRYTVTFDDGSVAKDRIGSYFTAKR